jgi:hypothetical protein
MENEKKGSYVTTHAQIQGELSKMDDENFTHTLHDIEHPVPHDGENVIYEKTPIEGGQGELYRKSFRVGEDGKVELGGDEQKVRRETNFVETNRLQALQVAADSKDVLLPTDLNKTIQQPARSRQLQPALMREE